MHAVRCTLDLRLRPGMRDFVGAAKLRARSVATMHCLRMCIRADAGVGVWDISAGACMSGLLFFFWFAT
jgi:hypothetical protein